MDNDFYRTHAISDSDNDSVIIIDPGTDQTNRTPYKDNCAKSPEEPDFFLQVIQHQKRKKTSSQILTFQCEKDASYSQNDLHVNEAQDSSYHTEHPKSNIYESKSQKDIELYNRNIPKSNIYTTTSDENTIEILEPKRKKRLSKEEMEEKKKEEMARKEAKKKLADKLKRLSPKECMKYITVHIDVNLQNQDYSEKILSEIQATDAKYKIESNSTVNSVTWSRQISDTNDEDESFMLLIWNFEYVKNLILSDQLIEKINFLRLHKAQLSIIICCTADELKKTKSKKNSKTSRSDMLNSLEQMMLSCCVSFRFIENKNDIALAILHFTKSIAQKPFKLNKYKEEQDGCDWYASGHTKNCVTVDKNGTGLTQLWRQMLSQFPLCTLETSEAIASVFKSPITLLEAYEDCSSRLEGETLLQDIPVRRGFGPLASNRRIGPELSKKIYIFFTDDNGCTTLSQE